MSPSARDRMLASTAVLVREHGARATSIDDVLRHSGAPRGSVYHHFPGGREQLLREATEFAAHYVNTRLAAMTDPHAMLEAFVDEMGDGCPIVAVAVEDGTEAQAAAGRAFVRWQASLGEGFERAGIPPERATLVIAALEGAIVLARAQSDRAPLESVREQLHQILKGPA